MHTAVDLGIIGAMQQEVEMLRDHLENSEVIREAQMSYYIGDLHGAHVVIAQSGIGKVNAALCTQLMIDRFHPAGIVFTGVAGGLLPHAHVGDFVVSTHTVQHDYDISMFRGQKGFVPAPEQLHNINPELFQKISDLLGTRAVARLEGAQFVEADHELRALACKAFEYVQQNQAERTALYAGVIASGDQFISDPQSRVWIQREFGAVCAEMEGAASAYTCEMNGTPFVILRAMSDCADGSAPENFDAFCAQAATLSASIVEQMARTLAQRLQSEKEETYKWSVREEQYAGHDPESVARSLHEMLVAMLTKEKGVIFGKTITTDVEHIYFDTKDQLLARHHALLRIGQRSESLFSVVCKLPGNHKRGLFSRLEYRRHLHSHLGVIQPTDTLYDVLRGSAVLEEIQRLSQSVGMLQDIDLWNSKPTVVLNKKRTTLPITLESGAQAFMYIDAFRARDPKREDWTPTRFEIEYELVPSSKTEQATEAFLDLASRIQKELPVEPSQCSKYERSLQLLESSP